MIFKAKETFEIFDNGCEFIILGSCDVRTDCSKIIYLMVSLKEDYDMHHSALTLTQLSIIRLQTSSLLYHKYPRLTRVTPYLDSHFYELK